MMSKAPPAHPMPHEDDINLHTRIVRSAADLARTLVNGSHPASAARVLASSGADSGKAGPSTSFGGITGSSSTWAQSSIGGVSREAAHSRRITQEQNIFRDGTREAEMQGGAANVREEMQAFDSDASDMHLDDSSAVSAYDQYLHNPMLTSKGKELSRAVDQKRPHETWLADFRGEGEDLKYTSQPTIQSYHLELGGDVHLAECQDGAAVLDILHDRESLTSPEVLSTEIQDAEIVSADDLFGGHITADEQRVIGNYTAKLPMAITTYHYPDQELLRDPSSATTPTLLNAFPILSGEIGSFDLWLSTWDEGMRNYTDDVWGPDLPFVRMAKEEVKNMREEPELALDVIAVERLKLILGHIKLPHRG